ncbi:hypothetical protein VNO78_19083 [Psophocarpus tetragonolobus]|uniref:Uncharacterized protein n=1 Tax=Psophocarpus tetragonolobus TaxID=3891 RepID=A0AAN9SBK5_PSOTE
MEGCFLTFALGGDYYHLSPAPIAFRDYFIGSKRNAALLEIIYDIAYTLLIQFFNRGAQTDFLWPRFASCITLEGFFGSSKKRKTISVLMYSQLYSWNCVRPLFS